MKKTTLATLITLAIAAITPATANAIEGSVGIGFSLLTDTESTSTYDSGTGIATTDERTKLIALPSINFRARIHGEVPVFAKIEYMRQAASGEFDTPINMLTASLEFQFRDGKTGLRPYLYGGPMVMHDSDIGTVIIGRIGGGVRYEIAKNLDLDAGMSWILGSETSAILPLTLGLNYKF